MNWLELHINTNHKGLDNVVALLSSLGIDSVVIDDETDFQEFLENNHQYWDYVDEDLQKQMAGRSRVTFYLADEPAAGETVTAVKIALSSLKKERSDLGELSLTMEGVQDSDWENNWKQFYKPMEIGERLLVVPEWETADPKGRVTLILNPGLTFGTGSHATTRLCLKALEQHIHGGETVLDLGCGSGILSIAALRLGASRAFACDIDEKCETVAYENAALNGVGRDVYTIRTGDVLSDEKLKAAIGGGYDMVVANIVSDVIVGLAPHVRPYLKEGGKFLCSGIIDTRADEVAAAIESNGFVITRRLERSGWCAFRAEKR